MTATPEYLKRLQEAAAVEDDDDRAAVARDTKEPTILRGLAKDPSSHVRAGVASNRYTEIDVLADIIENDENDDVAKCAMYNFENGCRTMKVCQAIQRRAWKYAEKKHIEDGYKPSYQQEG